MKLSVFTWNMQRRRSFLPSSLNNNKIVSDKVKEALISLCAAHDLGFITEPGQDIRGFIGSNNSPLPGVWIASGIEDNQSDSSACRPLIYSKNDILTSYDINFKSGGESAVRYPAAAKLSKDGHNILVVSMHATSGGGANNVQDFLDKIEEMSESYKAEFDAWLIGGDLNANEARWSPLRMPNVPTHQRGYTLDGFFSDRATRDGCMSIIDISRIETDKQFKLEIVGSKNKVAGCYFRNVKVSDHIPVTAQIDIKIDKKRRRPDYDANIDSWPSKKHKGSGLA